MAGWWSELTEAERRGARWFVLLLLLGTVHDLWRAHHPRLTPEPPEALARAPVTDTVGGPGAAAASASAVPAGIELNTATASELDRLPGIGPVLAARIVEHRRRHGPFRSPDDLLSVPGIGPRLLERLRPGLRTPARAAE
ncbi:MAG: helix-hairpin-helix domain-containing protein [Candidatus Eisenbacteria bacterium]